MPLNQVRVVEIIREECERAPDRCPGYRESIWKTVDEVLALERRHIVSQINIQQLIARKCADAGGFLADRREEPDGEDQL